MTESTRARELIALAQELDAKATAEPWYFAEYVPAPGGGEVHYRIQHQPEIVAARTFGDSLGDMQDAAFIAAARTAWPETARLLAEQIAATEAAKMRAKRAESASNQYFSLVETFCDALGSPDANVAIKEAKLLKANLASAEKIGRALGLEEAAQIFDAEAAAHARYATWIGPQRQYYKGARIPDIEMSPMNGPAFAHDNEIARATQIRALAKETK